MPLVTFQNLTSRDIMLGDIPVLVPTSKPAESQFRPAVSNVVQMFVTSVRLMDAPRMHQEVAAGRIALGITFTASEVDSGFTIFPGSPEAAELVLSFVLVDSNGNVIVDSNGSIVIRETL